VKVWGGRYWLVCGYLELMAQESKKVNFGVIDGAVGGASSDSASGASSGFSSGGQGMYLDPNTTSMFQAFALFMQQQQGKDRKEALAIKALQAVVNRVDQFDGKDISKYLRCYVREMELNRVSQEEMILLFELATVPEIREHVKSIIEQSGNSWETFSHALRDEYFLEDSDRVTKKSFLDWVERPNKNLQATELLREFERQYSRLSKMERLTLGPNKVELFLRATDGELQEKLEVLLEDKEEDEGLTTKWKEVEDAVGLLAKRERRKDKVGIQKVVQVSKTQTPTSRSVIPMVQPSMTTSKKEDVGIEELIRGMRDLQIKLARLEEKTSTMNPKSTFKQGYVQRCIWCDDDSHSRKDCGEFNEIVKQGIVFWKDGKVALKDTGDILQTNFGKGGMKALIKDYLAANGIAVMEAASYGTRVDDNEKQEFSRNIEPSGVWSFAISTMHKKKMPREALLRAAAIIRGTTGWEDPVETLSVHAYIAKNQHEALIEEKRKHDFNDTREGNSSKRQTRGDKA